MNFMNNDANIKQFRLVKFINENCSDDHVVTKISIVLRRDKIEAPYYMDSKIKLSSCIDMQEKGLIHAMDMLSHNRMHNLTEEAYDEIRSLIVGSDDADGVQITQEDKRLKVTMISRSDGEIASLFENYGELFEKIDNLVG